MAIIKNLNSDYIINTPLGAGSNITLSTDEVNIPGNLTVVGNLSVQGTTTSINSVNTNISDNIIILNDGESGAGVSAGASGIFINRGSSANVAILWLESYDKFVITDDGGSTFANILTSAAAGLTAVVEDTSPELGGNLSVNGFAITSSGYNTVLTGNVQLNNTLAIPSAQTNSTVLYATTPDAGQSGVYVVNQTSTNEELVTKRRAFGFSLIL